MKRHIKLIISVGLVLVTIAFLVIKSLQPLAVEAMVATRQDIEQTFKEEGIVVAETEQALYPVFNGEVTDVVAIDGQQVKRGDVLLKISTSFLNYQLRQLNGQLMSVKGQEMQSYRQPYQSQIMQQEYVIEGLQKQQADKKSDYEKAETDYKNMLITGDVLNQYKRALEEVSSQLKQQQEALKLIREQAAPLNGTNEYFVGLKASLQAQIDEVNQKIAQGVVYAPFDGVVKLPGIKKGEQVTTAAPVATILGNGSLTVESYVLPEDAKELQQGTDVRLILKGKAKDVEFLGSVKWISDLAVEKTSALGLVEHRVKVTVNINKGAPELKPGYSLDAKFKVADIKNCLVIPKSAVFKDQARDAVWVVKDGKAKLTIVEKGTTTDTGFIVRSGLNEGDTVIKNPELAGLKEGTKVRAKASR